MSDFQEQTHAGHIPFRPARKRLERILPLAAVLLLAVLAGIGTLAFYRYLDSALFAERNTHFIEISDKVGQVLSAEIQHCRVRAGSAEQLLGRTGFASGEAVLDRLGEIESWLSLDSGAVLAFDGSARLYASDGAVSRWDNASLLSGGQEVQEAVTDLPYRADSTTYMLFIRRLSSPVPVAGADNITHVALAVDIGKLQDAFDLDTFQEHSHIYVVDLHGQRLFQHRCETGFIDSYNLLTAVEACPFIHGGTAKDLRRTLVEGRSGGYEFRFQGEPYFVAALPVGATNWTLMSFVPTEALGAGTAAFMNTAVLYLAAIAVLVVAMLGLIIYLLVAKRGDRLLIAHQHQANILLRDAADAANAASTAKSDFLSHMSHDIRTPINGIMGMTDIALKNLDDRDRVLDCLKKIEGSSGHLLSLVNDVLDMSRIESGKTRIAREPMDLRQVISHCASIVSGQLQGRDVALVEEFETLSHPRLLGDELHLRQVLINILGNAVKFTPDGGKIFFRCRELGTEGDAARFRLEVEDTGIGMKPEFLPIIFEPFAQEEGGSRSTYKGTGLGMSITKQFVDLMGGTIQVESEPGRGSLFRLEFLIDIDRDYQEVRESGFCRLDLTGSRLLLAEDNELNMEIALYMLEDEGIEAVPAQNGQEAVEIFSASPPGAFDGILMDVMMPVMDGLAATRAIRALKRADAGTIPIIAMTANAYDEDRRRCLEAGMNAHVAKPIDSATLIQVLSHYIPFRSEARSSKL